MVACRWNARFYERQEAEHDYEMVSRENVKTVYELHMFMQNLNTSP